ncbi:unnamed protein product [Dibothriocephalus latus]|uniref:Uncharacterized protein n=1 Tax=Dibothriocephalus latus TaxID=60516 RepID=A0A3P7LJV6_DIBLA|nr:unnamed protein product [Dibothriocephalus latus]
MAATIFETDEEIKEGQLVVHSLCHCKLDVREVPVEALPEREHLIPFDDDEGVVHIPRPEFLSPISEDQQLQSLLNRLSYQSRNR